MDGHPIHHLRLGTAPLQTVPESRWEAIEADVREGLAMGIQRFILDFAEIATIRPLDYWMLLNLAILIPAGGLVVVCQQEQLAAPLTRSRLTSLITCVPYLPEAYAILTGVAAGPELAHLRTAADRRALP